MPHLVINYPRKLPTGKQISQGHLSDFSGHKRHNRFSSRRPKNFCCHKRNPEQRRHQNHTITEYELLKYKTTIKKQPAKKFLSIVTVCSFDRDAAKKAAELFRELQQTGRMVNENDLLIARIALAHDEVLLTRKQKLAKIAKAKLKPFSRFLTKGRREAELTHV